MKRSIVKPSKFARRKSMVAAFRQHAGVALSLFLLAVVGSPSAAWSAAGAAAPDLVYASFGSVEIGISAQTVSPKAIDLFHRTDRESGAYSDCSESGSCAPEIALWRDTVRGLDGTEGVKLLTAVNAAVNAMITYRDDRSAYGKADYWATPEESLTGYGDCEDYAIVKYLSLIELGIAHDRMRIVVLKDNKRQIGHAVLAVSLGGVTYVLDNVRSRATPDSELPHYRPIYSFNQNRQWLNVAVRPRGDQVVASAAGAKRAGVIPPAAQDEAAGMSPGTSAD